MSKKYFEELLRQHEYLKTLSRSDSIYTYASKQVEDHDLQDFMALYKQAGFWSFLKDLAHSTAVNLQIFDTVAENIADELEENNYDGARKILLEATNKLIEDQEITKKLKAIPNEQITSEVISKMATDMTNGIVAKLNKSVKAELTGSGMMLDPDGLASLIFEALGGNEEGKQASSQFNLIKQADVGDIAIGSASTIGALMSWNIGKKVVKATPEAIKKATELFQQAVKSLGSKATDTAYRDALYKSIRQALVEKGVPEPARVAKLTADKLAAEAVKRPQAANLIKNILTKIVKAPAGVATQAVKTAYEKLIKSPKLVGLAKKLGPKWPKIATAIASKLGPRLGALTAAGGIPYVGQIIAALGIADMIGNEVSMGEGVPEAEWNRIFDRGAIRAQIFAQLSAVATQMTGKTYEDKGQTTQEGKPTQEQKDQFYTYKVQKGDSLSGIAAKELGNQNLWKKIHELNPQIQDPNKIFEGQELKLPGKGSVTLKAQPSKAPAKPDVKPKSSPKAPTKPAQQPGTAPAQQPGTAPAQQARGFQTVEQARDQLAMDLAPDYSLDSNQTPEEKEKQLDKTTWQTYQFIEQAAQSGVPKSYYATIKKFTPDQLQHIAKGVNIVGAFESNFSIEPENLQAKSDDQVQEDYVYLVSLKSIFNKAQMQSEADVIQNLLNYVKAERERRGL